MSEHQPQFNLQPPSNGFTPKQYLYITYACFALGALTGFTFAIIGVVMAYLKRNEFSGSLYGDHLQFLIRTFWGCLIGSILGFILAFIFIGWLLIFAVGIWYLVRIVVGIIKLLDNQSVTPTGWLI